MSGHRYILAGLLTLFLSFVDKPAFAAVPSDEAIARFFDSHVSSAISGGEVPGAALVVVRDGRVILNKGYGFADLARRDPMSPSHHLLRQGSISKLVPWVLAMQLVESGKLDLDRDVNAYLPFRIPLAFGKPITMRHLLTHSGGFAERFIGIYGRPSQPLCKAVEEHLPQRVAAPGTRISYSNSGAALAACIVERLAGRDFERLGDERVIEPAGMTSSTFMQPPPPLLRRRLASFYGASTDQPHSFEQIAVAPAGALSATADDMGRLLLSFMDQGRGKAGALLKPETLGAMKTLQLPLAPGLESGMGLGFIVREHRGVRFAGHGGTMAAAITDLEMLPDHGVGWYIGMNGLGLGGSAVDVRENLPRAVIDRFFAEAKAPVARGPSSASEASGAWLPARRFRQGPLKLSDVNLIALSADAAGNLFIDSVTNEDGRPRAWVPQGRDRFADSKTGAPLVLVRDADGNIVRFASMAVNAVTDFERAPKWTPAALPLLGVSSASIVFAFLAMPIGWAWRKARRRRGVERSAPERRWRRIAQAGVTLLAVTLVGWLALMAVVSDDPYKLTAAGLWIALLGSLATLSPLAAAGIVGNAVAAWKSGGRAARIGRAAVALAAVVLAVLFYTFGLTTTTLDF